MSRPRRPHRVIDGVVHWQCGVCTAWLPESQYTPQRARGVVCPVQSACRACRAAYVKARRAADPEATRAYMRQYQRDRRAIARGLPCEAAS